MPIQMLNDFTQLFVHELNLVSDIAILLAMKEVIKEQVMNANLNWQDRIVLYKKVQLVNERIDELQLKITSTGKQ